MNFDLRLFSSKLKKLLDMQEYALEEFSELTKVPLTRMKDLVSGNKEPTGGEILIFSDVLKTEHEYFMSNEVVSLVEKTETFFRNTQGIIRKNDKRIISETLKMAIFYKYLQDLTGKRFLDFKPTSNSANHVEQGRDAGIQLRRVLRYPIDKIDINPFSIASQMGIQVYWKEHCISMLTS